MTSEQAQVINWMTAFGQDCPSNPTIPRLEIRALRAKLILEEAIETFEALGFKWQWDKAGNYVLNAEVIQPNLKEIADGCEDIKVVTDGTLVACGLVKIQGDTFPVGSDPLFNEVMRSNFSKMWTHEEVVASTVPALTYKCTQPEYGPKDRVWLVTDVNGKVIKSPSYSPANLQPIIDSYSK